MVAVAEGFMAYGAAAPYSPHRSFPAFVFSASTLSPAENPAYDGVRAALELLGLDSAHVGTAEWNPLAEIVQPGDTVVLKPNFVREFRETHTGHDDCVITHGAVIRAVL